MTPRARCATILVCAGLTSCADGDEPVRLPDPTPVTVPAGTGASLPYAAEDDDGVLVSWVEPSGDGHALRFARWDGTDWTQPRTVAEGRDWFVNWADFPSIRRLPGGRLAAHWLQRSGPGTYAYDVLVTWSDDGGATWAPALRPHRDGTETEHGFVSLFPHGDALGIVWLDGRQYAAAGEAGGSEAGASEAGGSQAGGSGAGHDGHGAPSSEMMVRFTTIAASGVAGEEVELDGRACDCCQTAVAVTSRGPVVFYRDRSPDEIRDISVTRLSGGAWSDPRPVHEDGWHITGCPVNGPAADSRSDVIALAWFTAADGEPRVNVVFSRDAGDTFPLPVRVDDGNPIGRVDLLMLAPDLALVVWLEEAADGGEVRGRLVTAGGRAGPSRTLASTSAQRASGFPRMARRSDDVLLLWTVPGEAPRIEAAALSF
jgi:hypothetical protein